MTTILSIHQPNYLPWLGYFHKMTYSDVFVFLDNVQYTPKTYTNRCFVLQGNNQTRLSIPVSLKTWDVPILEVEINTDEFARKHLATLRHAYGRCAAFAQVLDVLKPHYEAGKTNLAEFNIGLITALARFAGLTTQFVRASELGVTTAKNALLRDITMACGGDVFVSGTGARSYIVGHEQEYADAGLTLAYQNFVHPEYGQRTGDFVPGCSFIDLLFNAGRDAKNILASQSDPGYEIWCERSV